MSEMWNCFCILGVVSIIALGLATCKVPEHQSIACMKAGGTWHSGWSSYCKPKEP
jgi:hypothetical protein